MPKCFYRDFFTVQLAPYKIEFGHVCEDPDDWEERYERKDLKNHRDQGKVNNHLKILPHALLMVDVFLDNNNTITV